MWCFLRQVSVFIINFVKRLVCTNLLLIVNCSLFGDREFHCQSNLSLLHCTYLIKSTTDEKHRVQKMIVVLWGILNGLTPAFEVISAKFNHLFLCRGPACIFLGVSDRDDRILGVSVRTHHNTEPAWARHFSGFCRSQTCGHKLQ